MPGVTGMFSGTDLISSSNVFSLKLNLSLRLCTSDIFYGTYHTIYRNISTNTGLSEPAKCQQ